MGILKIIAGAAMIAAGALVTVGTMGGGAFLGATLITAGAGMVLGGVGSLIQGDPQKGLSTTTRNPIAPWRILYGQARVGGTLVHEHMWGDNDQMLDLVIVVASHTCEGVDELLFDQQRIQIDTAAAPGGAAAGSGTSFTPVQQKVNITTIVRDANGVVTVTLGSNIPYLTAGDRILIGEDSAGTVTSNALIGTFQVEEIISRTGGGIVFTYLSGGTAVSISGRGYAHTLWADYGRDVYFEPILGRQTLGQTFAGMTSGTPWQGSGRLVKPESPGSAGGDSAPNPWTPFCSLVGKTAVFLRLKYSSHFKSGLPQISFLVRGKNDIYDPRTNSNGYSENAALCIGDFLANQTWGFKASYGTNIPLDPLSAAAEACDRPIPLAIGGTEPRYSCNGQFELTLRRGEILQNLLTSCAGRITYVSGEYRIHPGIWTGPTTPGGVLAAIVQNASAGQTFTANPGSNTLTLNVTLASPVTAGNTLIVAIAGAITPTASGGGITAPRVTDSLGNGFTEACWADAVLFAPGVGVFFATGITGGSDTVTLSVTANNPNPTFPDFEPVTITVMEVSGMPSPSVQDFSIRQPGAGLYALGATITDSRGSSVTTTFAGIFSQTSLAVLDLFSDGGDYLISVLANGPGTIGPSPTPPEVTIPADYLTYSLEGDPPIGSPPAYFMAAFFGGPGAFDVGLLTMPMLAGPIKWRPKPSIRDLYNGCKGTFISPANHWQSSDFPAYAQDSLHGYSGPPEFGGDINLAADGGDRRWLELHLPFTTSASMAQRIAKIELLRRRHGGTGTFRLNMSGYQFLPLDIIEADIPFLGWNATGSPPSPKVLEVAAVRFHVEPAQGGPSLGTEIDVQETDSAIYAWSTEEELSPEGYQQTSLPGNTVVEPVPYPWSPGYAIPHNGDAMFPRGTIDRASFGIKPVYALDAHGTPSVTFALTGHPPINALDDGIASPYATAVGSGTGGSIPAGQYVIGVTAYDSGSPGYKNTRYLDVVVVVVPNDGGSITVSITWGSGDDGGDVYMALWVPGEAYTWHHAATLAPGATSATITTWNQSTPGGPDPLVDHLSVVRWPYIHGGPWAEQIQAVTATTITIGQQPGDPAMTTDQWAGRVLSLLAKWDQTVEIPVLNMPIASSSASSGGQFTLTIGPNANGDTLPDLTTLLAVADLVLMRFSPTFTDTGFSDPEIANPYFPSGMSGVEAGHLVAVLTGPDAGDIQTIASVSGTGGTFTDVTLAGKWKITPNTGDIVIVLGPQAPEAPSNRLSVPNNTVGASIVGEPVIENLGGQAWVVGVRTEDAQGNHTADDAYIPLREIFLFGAQGTRNIATSQTMLPTDSLLVVDATGGNVVVTCLPFAQTPNQEYNVVKVDSSANTVTIQTSGPGDTFDDGTTSHVILVEGDSFSFRVHGA